MIVKEDPICTKETLILGGSTAFAPLVVTAAGEFARRACAREVSVRNEGSWAGVADVLTGAVDAAFVDVEFNDAQNDLLSYPVAAFAIAFITNPSACVSGLTKGQLSDILSGRIRNWREAGGADCAIELINRNRASGVRSVVEDCVLSNRSIVKSTRCAESNRLAALAVKDTPGGFSYVALPRLQRLDIVALAVDDVPPSNQHVLSGMYPFWTYARVLVWPAMRDRILRFVDYVVEGSDLCEMLGYISLNRMERSHAAAMSA
jgi:phosphate transport system substrate-binding protein